MHKLALGIPAVLLAVACTGPSTPQQGAVQQLAVACHVAVETAALALEDGASTTPAPDPGPGPGPGPGGGGTSLPIACCTNPAGCTPMTYPVDICWELPEPTAATTLARHSVVPYTGDGTTTAFFASCAPPTGEQCDAAETSYVFTPYPHTRWVAAFVPNGAGGVSAELYAVPPGTTAVKIPSGAQVFPLLEATDGFRHPGRPVSTPDGIRYVDMQNDCIPRPDGCGFTCSTC
jgi:hypothetical protein